ncbi:MAG TPA: sugar-binding domain-containing protein [Limnochordia bacterium]
MRRIAPEVTESVERRYQVLQHVFFHQPIGRRTLAARLGWPERLVRRELDFLREADLVLSKSGGMQVGPMGERVLEGLKAIIRDLHGLAAIEQALAEYLSLQQVIVVPGDADRDETVKGEIARATAQYLSTVLDRLAAQPEKGGRAVLAVTGGSTLAEVARVLPQSGPRPDLTVVPARGGLGEEVELQANTVAAHIAQRLGGSYRLLHIPDDLGEEAASTIANEPKIRQLLELIRNADIVLHGIGTAEEMARRRGLPPDVVRLLHERRSVGEAFGYYFDAAGQIVYTTSSVGLRFEDLASVPLVVAVGGGHTKAEAALAVLSTQHQHVYITDEGAARRMVEKLAGADAQTGRGARDGDTRRH